MQPLSWWPFRENVWAMLPVYVTVTRPSVNTSPGSPVFAWLVGPKTSQLGPCPWNVLLPSGLVVVVVGPLTFFWMVLPVLSFSKLKTRLPVIFVTVVLSGSIVTSWNSLFVTTLIVMLNAQLTLAGSGQVLLPQPIGLVTGVPILGDCGCGPGRGGRAQQGYRRNCSDNQFAHF